MVVVPLWPLPDATAAAAAAADRWWPMAVLYDRAAMDAVGPNRYAACVIWPHAARSPYPMAAWSMLDAEPDRPSKLAWFKYE